MTAQSDAAVASVAPVVSLTVESALQENRILAWYRGESRQEIERILYIDLAADRLYVIALNDDHVWPKPRTCSEVEAALAVADAVVIPEAEALGAAAYSRLHMPDDEYYALIAERAGNRQRSTDERERTQRAWSGCTLK